MTAPDENINPTDPSADLPPDPFVPADLGRIVVLAGSFPPMLCGVGDSAYELAKEMACQGADIEAVVDAEAKPHEIEDGENRNDSCPFPIHADIDSWGLRNIKQIVRRIEKLEPGIIHIHYPSKAYGKGLAVPFIPMLKRSRRRKFKVVVTLHEFRLSHSLRKLASFVLLDAADAVVMPCPLELEALKKRHVSMEQKITTAIPVGPVGPKPDDYTEDQKIEMRRKARSEWGAGDKDIVLLHYGTPAYSKGLEILFKAMRLLKLEGETPLLVIAGDFRPDGDGFHKLLSGQPRGLNIHEQVKWLGCRPMEELPGIFLGADIGMFPFLDGFSFRRSSLVGVLQWDVPIITTKPLGYLLDLNEQGKVKFVEPNDPKALSTALLNYIANPMAYRNLKNLPNPLMKTFRWDSIARQYFEIYRQVLEET